MKKGFWQDFKRAAAKRVTWWMLVLAATGMMANPIVSDMVHKLYPERPFVPDLFFSFLPFMEWTQYLSDPLLMLEMVVFIYYVAKYAMKRLPEVLFGVGFIHWARALLIILTPMGRVYAYAKPYGIFQGIITHGQFPSGHAAAAALMFFLIEDKRRKLKWSCFWLLVGQIAVLLLSRGHYSIDIAGGLMIAYIAHRKGDDWARKLRV